MTANRLNLPHPDFDRPTAVLLLLWVLAMISLPIVKWTLGESALQRGIVVGVLMQVLAVVVILAHAWGWSKTLRTAATVTALAWLAEAIGSASGFPFGAYSYTDVLQPQLTHVPLLIPLAWLMMLPPAWAVAQAITGRSGRAPRRQRLRQGLAFVTVSALAFTAWDLFLDPQMVAWNFWQWHSPGGYFGIPWQNFLGWLLVSALITVLARPSQLPIGPLLAVYAVTWALETIGQLFFWDLPGPALVGFTAMGGMLFWAVHSLRSRGQWPLAPSTDGHQSLVARTADPPAAGKLPPF